LRALSSGRSSAGEVQFMAELGKKCLDHGFSPAILPEKQPEVQL